MRLAVIGDTRHHRDANGALHTIEPLTRQLDQWAALVDEMVLVAPLDAGAPPPGFAPYESSNVSIRPIRRAGGNTLGAKATILVAIPSWWRAIRRITRDVDAVHLRCPCNVGLVALLATWGRPRLRYAIYAGTWERYAGEPWSYRAQRWLLRHYRGPVSVYTPERIPGTNLIPFFSPSLTDDQWAAEETAVARRVATLGKRPGVVRLVTIGRLTKNKDQATAIRALRELRNVGLDATLVCIGEGPEEPSLRELARRLAVEHAVTFTGQREHADVLAALRDADVHVLATHREGFGKVVLEAMTTGAVTVAAESAVARGLLGDGARGEVFVPGDAAGCAAGIRAVVDDSARWGELIANGREHARTMTIEAFAASVEEMLGRHWGFRR